MDVNGISSVSAKTAVSYENTAKAATVSNESTYGKDAAAVYEKSDAAKNASSNKALIAKLKADSEARISQMQNLVREMFAKQGTAVTNADQMWKLLAQGDFTVDEKTAADAQAAISEDGYWCVNQTSQRIFDFAVALSGGDSEQMDKMLAAFKKGFDQATKAWGKSLPSISSQTYDAVLEKFEAYKNQSATEETDA